MASKDRIQELRSICEECTATPVDGLVSKPEWGEFDFLDVKDDLSLVFDILKDFLTLPVHILPEQTIQGFSTQLQPLQQTIEEIKSFSIKSDNPSHTRDDIAHRLKDHVQRVFTDSQQWIPYLAYRKGGFQTNIEKLSSTLNDAKELLSDAKEEVQSKRAQVDETVAAAREAAASVGVAHFTAEFSKEADRLATSAKWWLGGSGLFGLSALVTASLFLLYPPKADGLEMVYFAAGRIAILGMLFYVTVWCSSVYKALMHQVTINRHRANSIKTFQAFTQAASDDAMKDAVLMETTKAVFAQVSTGYLAKEAGGDNAGGSQLRIVDLAREAPKALDPKSSPPS